MVKINSFNNYTPATIVSNFRIHGSKVQKISYSGRFTRDGIRKHMQKQADDLATDYPNYAMAIALKFDNLGWRGGDIFPIGEQVRIYDPSDSSFDDDDVGEIKQFRVFTFKPKIKQRQGGNGDHNDCLFECLNDSLRVRNKFFSGAHLKKYLGLKRDDKVDIKYIPKVENYLRSVRINVEGDHTYTSVKGNLAIEINIRLIDGHYSLIEKEPIQVRGTATKEKIPVIYDLSETNGKNEKNVKICIKGKEKYITLEKFRNIRSKPRTSQYILIPKNDNKTLTESYENFITDANILKEETNGMINMYMTGKNTKTALQYFYDLTKYMKPAEPIGATESRWIENSVKGPMVYSEPYKGPGYQYDIVSMYPSLMIDKKFKLPIKKGSFMKLTDTEFNSMKTSNSFKVGIYRCVINRPEDFPFTSQSKSQTTCNKLFKINETNYYTHFDLERAAELKFDVKLIHDDEPNALIYAHNELIYGSVLFEEIVKKLFCLKSKGITRAKQILNSLWGALSERNQIKLFVKEGDLKVEIYDNKEVIALLPAADDDSIMVKLANRDSYYETNYSRICPFLLSLGRYTISKLIESNVDSIVRLHTDGFLSSKELPIKTGVGLGQLKYIGHCPETTVVNMRKPTGIFTV